MGFFLSFFILVGLYPVQLHAAIYESVDQQGRAYFSDKASEDAVKIEIQAPPPRSNDLIIRKRAEKRQNLLDAYARDREKKEAALAREQEKKKERVMNCEKIRKRMEKMHDAHFLYEETDDPYNPRILSAKERKQAEQKLQQQERQWCD